MFWSVSVISFSTDGLQLNFACVVCVHCEAVLKLRSTVVFVEFSWFLAGTLSLCIIAVLTVHLYCKFTSTFHFAWIGSSL